MYRFKDKDTFAIYNKCEVAKVIGITRQYLGDIINNKKNCSKLVAYCITKFIDSEKEIEDFFERV